ncbi:MAG: DUF308 domain-containing protein [Ignavibacteriales bacterium]|nr:DUF308 domain-containing protein [Ignavibacteriales bacterium]
MDNNNFKSAKDVIKHWYIVLIIGVIFIGLGMWVIPTPEAAFVSLSILFSITFLITDILEIISSIDFRNKFDGWEQSLAIGFFDVIIGLMIPMQSEISIVVLQLMVGFVMLYRSVMGINWLIGMNDYDIPSWSWLLIISIISGALSILILGKPAFVEMTISLLTGLALISVGIFYISLSLAIKKLKINQ